MNTARFGKTPIHVKVKQRSYDGIVFLVIDTVGDSEFILKHPMTGETITIYSVHCYRDAATRIADKQVHKSVVDKILNKPKRR